MKNIARTAAFFNLMPAEVAKAVRPLRRTPAKVRFFAALVGLCFFSAVSAMAAQTWNITCTDFVNSNSNILTVTPSSGWPNNVAVGDTFNDEGDGNVKYTVSKLLGGTPAQFQATKGGTTYTFTNKVNNGIPVSGWPCVAIALCFLLYAYRQRSDQRIRFDKIGVSPRR